MLLHGPQVQQIRALLDLGRQLRLKLLPSVLQFLFMFGQQLILLPLPLVSNLPHPLRDVIMIGGKFPCISLLKFLRFPAMSLLHLKECPCF